MFKLLKNLSQTPGIPGNEEQIREVIRDELEEFVDEIRTDALGNIACKRTGTGGGPRILIAAHMDEIGFLVKHIEEDGGFLRIEPVGGFDPRLLLAQRVLVHGTGGRFPGVIGTKPIHLLEEEEKQKTPKIRNLFVDLGMDHEEVKGRIEVGDQITMDQSYKEFGNVVCGKALDDRVGVFVGIEAIKKLARENPEHKADVYFVGTTQEEVGLRGAGVAGYKLEPDIGIALDVTIALDIPDTKDREKVTKLGKGAAIKIKDSRSISNPKIVKTLRQIAREEDIPYQMEILPSGGTDAGAIQLTREGVAVATISIPSRYVHSVVESAARTDIEAAIDLLTSFIGEAHHHSFAL